MIPIAGDWNGDGVVTVGLYNPTTGTFTLSNSNAAGGASTTFPFGPTNSGMCQSRETWTGASNGKDTIGLYDPTTGTFFLRDSNTAGVADMTFVYGPANSTWCRSRGTGPARSSVIPSACTTDDIDVLPEEQQHHRLFRYHLRLWPGR